MCQDIFVSWEFDFDAKPLQPVVLSNCQDMKKQRIFVAQELKRIGDGINIHYEFGAALCGMLRDFKIQDLADALLIGFKGIFFMKMFLY